MFNDRAIKKSLNRTFENALWLVCKGSESKLEKLNEEYVTIHQHNLQLLLVDIFKTKSNINSKFMKNTFIERDVQYNLRSKNHLVHRSQFMGLITGGK